MKILLKPTQSQFSFNKKGASTLNTKGQIKNEPANEKKRKIKTFSLTYKQKHKCSWFDLSVASYSQYVYIVTQTLKEESFPPGSWPTLCFL